MELSEQGIITITTAGATVIIVAIVAIGCFARKCLTTQRQAQQYAVATTAGENATAQENLSLLARDYATVSAYVVVQTEKIRYLEHSVEKSQEALSKAEREKEAALRLAADRAKSAMASPPQRVRSVTPALAYGATPAPSPLSMTRR